MWPVYVLCLPSLGLLFPLLRIVLLCDLFLVLSGSLVVCEGLETQGNTDLVGLLETDALFHGHLEW